MDQQDLWPLLIKIVLKEGGPEGAWSLSFWDRVLQARPDLAREYDAVLLRKVFEERVVPRIGEFISDERIRKRFVESVGKQEGKKFSSTEGVRKVPSVS